MTDHTPRPGATSNLYLLAADIAEDRGVTLTDAMDAVLAGEIDMDEPQPPHPPISAAEVAADRAAAELVTDRLAAVDALGIAEAAA